MEKVLSIELKPKVAQFLTGTKKLFINGEWVPSASGKTFNTVNPSTGELLAIVSEAQKEDIDLAV
ncbi:MAG: betaine-aldehyde dehydrogenase, partial [Bacillota bacterium]